MAKTTKAQTIFGDDLVTLAEKFGRIPNSYTKTQDIIDDGYLTQEEFDNLPFCPRSTEMTAGSAWCKIGGRKTYPLSGVLTPEETQMYYDYKKEHKAGGVSVTGGKQLSEETQKIIDNIREFLKDNNASSELLAQFESLIPHKKSTLLEQMFNVSTPFALKGKVNMAYVMYRSPEGKFAEDLQPNLIDLIEQEYEPVFTKAQVRENVAKLKDKGIDCTDCIVDL